LALPVWEMPTACGRPSATKGASTLISRRCEGLRLLKCEISLRLYSVSGEQL
jgi:hypothetical protein